MVINVMVHTYVEEMHTLLETDIHHPNYDFLLGELGGKAEFNIGDYPLTEVQD